MTNLGNFSEWPLGNWPFLAKRGVLEQNALLKIFNYMTFFLRCILYPQMTVENDKFRAFFKIVLRKLVICGKRGHFRAKSQEIKFVGNAILRLFPKDAYAYLSQKRQLKLVYFFCLFYCFLHFS